MKFLIFCLPGIGDALMATPMIKVLKKKFPKAKIDIGCMFEGVRYVFKNNPYISNIHKLSLYNENKFRGLKQIIELRKKNYDISILTLPAYRREYHITQWLVGAKKRITHRFTQGYFSEFNFLNTDLVPVDETVHNVINNLNLLKVLNIDWKTEIKIKNIKYNLILDKKDISFGIQFINGLNWGREEMIGIHPGSTISPAALLRRWPIDHYAKLIKYLMNQEKKKVLIFVGPDEANLGIELYNLVEDKKNCKLINNVKFKQAIGILNQCSMLICNDNGFGHVANALNIPIITLWASTNSFWSLPYNKDLVTLIRPKNFKPWYRYDLKRSIPNGATSGMELISVDTVIGHINQLTI